MQTIHSHSTCVEINGTPYAKNWLRVRYDGDFVEIYLQGNNGSPVLRSDVAALSCDGVVLSMGGLKVFVIENFFCCGSTGNSGDGGETSLIGTAMIKEITITEETLLTVPIPEGMTVYDTHHYTGDADGGAWRQPVPVGDSLDIAHYGVVVGDTLVIYGEKTS